MWNHPIEGDLIVADTFDELNTGDPRFVGLISTAADEGAPDSAVIMMASSALFVLMMSFGYLF